jgi:hypothetical protein
MKREKFITAIAAVAALVGCSAGSDSPLGRNDLGASHRRGQSLSPPPSQTSVIPNVAERGAFGGAPSRRALVPQSGGPSLKWRAKAPSGVAQQVVATHPPLQEGDTSKRSGAPASTQESAKPAAQSLNTTPLAKRFRALDK